MDDLHSLALAESGRLVLRREAVALGDIVDNALERHDAQARPRAVQLRATIAPDLPPAWLDPLRVRQVLDNLITNAIRHTPAGGVVSVSIVEVGGVGHARELLCRVTDAGPGFRDDELEQVFDRFTTAGDSRGSGLGLSIVRDLVLAHGGSIDAGNDPSTGGASVAFTLPTSATTST